MVGGWEVARHGFTAGGRRPALVAWWTGRGAYHPEFVSDDRDDFTSLFSECLRKPHLRARIMFPPFPFSSLNLNAPFRAKSVLVADG